jgi:hypothetical protein
MQTITTNSACSDKQAHLAHRLHEAVPQGAKMALCFDPEGDLDNLEHVVDGAGRLWRILTYREDDLAFRLIIRELEAQGWNADSPVLIRVTMPEFVPLTHQMNLSYLSDVLMRVEGEPIDLRTDAVINFHTEPAVWPENLQDHAVRISRDLVGFLDGYRRMRRTIGNRPLGRHHVAAVLLLAKYRELNYQDLELPHAYPAEMIARFLTLAAEHQLDADDERLLWDVLTVTSHLSDLDHVKPWMAFPTGESLTLLALTDLLDSCGVQNAALSLSGLGLFSRPVHDLMPILDQVRAHLKDKAHSWRHIVQQADQACTQDQAERAVSLLEAVIPPDQWMQLVRDDIPRIVVLALLLGYLDVRLAKDENATLDMPASIPAWAEPWMHGWDVPHHDAPAEARAATLLRMFSRVVIIQCRLAATSPQANDIGALVNDYIESGDAYLELYLAFARKEADVIDDETRLGRLQVFFDNLQHRLLTRMQAFDTIAGELIRHDVQRYLQHPRSTVRFLKPVADRVRHRRQRLFVWLFDGMRYDTWVEVIRPILTQNFAIEEEKPLLAPLPTYTQLARKALFAGGYPDTAWKGFGGRFTPDEQILAARNFGLTSEREMKQETVFVDHADTDTGKEKLRKLKVRQYNCLVFNISDDNLHIERGDLREINDKIRQKVERDVLPEMKRLVGPDDIIVITSDHGFVELADPQRISINEHEAESRVFYRYLYDLEHPAGVVVPYSGKKGLDRVTALIGRAWFSREKGRYTRYAHGGVSLPEMVVPGVVLHKLVAPEEIRLAISSPERLRGREDEEIEIPVTIKNNGPSLVTLRVTIGQTSGKSTELGRGAERTFTELMKAEMSLRFVPVTIEVKGLDGRYAVVKGGNRQIPVTVKERTDKVEFSKALDVFNDLA